MSLICADNLFAHHSAIQKRFITISEEIYEEELLPAYGFQEVFERQAYTEKRIPEKIL